jgi:hypothetical protein
MSGLEDFLLKPCFIANRETAPSIVMLGDGGYLVRLPLDKLTNVSYYLNNILTFVSIQEELQWNRSINHQEKISRA